MADNDNEYISRAIRLALDAESRGNLPVGAVITLDGIVIAEAGSAILTPVYHPGRHAETEALRQVPVELWPRSREMTCYTTLEPCVMCFGALLLHGVGRVVFGANDSEGGATAVLGHLPRYYAGGVGVPEWVGPVASEECDELYMRVGERFERLPVVGRVR
ncbi:MAG TPA: nucleoside deaminase [Pyrinomonadaceae bacterium]|jgi:tRNA(adenine34) deaminase